MLRTTYSTERGLPEVVAADEDRDGLGLLLDDGRQPIVEAVGSVARRGLDGRPDARETSSANRRPT
ncbi:MAG: hypothetical protein WDM88_05600 [Galbitalea sp.]